MDEISNRTLAVLLVAALVVSLFGTIAALNRISKLGVPIITGAVTTGTAAVTISSQTEIDFTTDSVDFGSGYVNDTSGPCPTVCCDLDTESAADALNCKGGLASPAAGFVIENIGTTNCKLNLSFDNDADSFLGGTNPGYAFKVSEANTNDCNTGLAYTNYQEITAAANYTVCTVFNTTASDDEMNLDIRINMSGDMTIGTHTDTVTGFAYT